MYTGLHRCGLFLPFIFASCLIHGSGHIHKNINSMEKKEYVVQLTIEDLKKIVKEAINEDRSEKTSNTLKEVFGLDEFCEMTGYSRQTAYKLVHERKVPFYKPEHGGRKILFKRKEVEEWLTATRVCTLDEFCDDMERSFRYTL